MPKDTFMKLKPNKKEKIIEATIKELSLHPYEHVNLANIIRDAGIARGSFYQYFSDKDDLYMFFTMVISEKKGEFFKDIFDMSQDLPFLDRFKAIYIRGFEFAKAYPELVKAGYNMTQSSLFRSSDLYKASYESGIQFFESLIKIDQQKKRIRSSIDARFLAESILDYMNKMNLDYYIHTSESLDDIKLRTDAIIDILKKGIVDHV
ncbi:MAG: TetR/AcrR family transcriptional regulator [Acholeplasmataceae bacterium]|jgi:AcrR family transcriptional regulator|nr:TetR/AcrR family transcriptional regulator [Acholeplasmataceae bacterium]